MSVSKKVLVVEDEMSLQTIISLSLKKNNFSPVFTKSVNEAIDALVNDPGFLAVWIDHYLFGDSLGSRLVEKLKDSEEWSNLPVIVVSNTEDLEVIEEYNNLEVTQFYNKSKNGVSEIINDLKLYLSKK